MDLGGVTINYALKKNSNQMCNENSDLHTPNDKLLVSNVLGEQGIYCTLLNVKLKFIMTSNLNCLF